MARLIVPVAAGREIVAYGNSVGAYAALYFGGALNARILSIAPRNTIHPLISVNPAQTAPLFTHRERLEDGPLSTHVPLVLFDPHQPKDARLVRRWILPAYPDADLRPLTRTGHSVIAVLQAKGLLRGIAEAFFRGDPVPPIRMGKEGTPDWHFAEGHRLQSMGDPEGALVHYRAALDGERHKNLLLMLARCAAEVGDEATYAAANDELAAMKRDRRQKRQRSDVSGSVPG